MDVAVIGAGPWGRNHVRVYTELHDAELRWVADSSPEVCSEVKARFGTKLTDDPRTVLADKDVEAVSICTPASSHTRLVHEALDAGKHVLVEKPLALTVDDGQALVDRAKEVGLTLMVGHVFRFDPTIRYARREIEAGTFGRVYYLSLSRMGLKRPREDCGVIHNYAVHDFDIMADLLASPLPEEVTAITHHVLGRPFEDLALVTLRFPGDVMGYCQVSWLPPKKIRDIWLVGEDRSALINTMDMEVEVYDAGIIPNYDDFGTFRLITRQGDLHHPHVERTEPLRQELGHFLECARTGREPVTSGEVGLNALRMADAALTSARDGRTVRL